MVDQPRTTAVCHSFRRNVYVHGWLKIVARHSFFAEMCMRTVQKFLADFIVRMVDCELRGILVRLLVVCSFVRTSK